jgi:hypothetical protein
MKKALNLTITLAGICLLFTCSGCLLTERVTNSGVRKEWLAVNHVLVSTNGSIALDCTATYACVYPTLVEFGENNLKSKKYLVGSPEVVLWTVTNAIATDKTRLVQNTSSRLESAVPDVLTNLVIVTNLVYATTNTMKWILIPSKHGGRDATQKDLPQEFHGFVFSYQNGAIPYELNGRSLQVQLPSCYYNKNRTSRRWWGYPMQILFFPAVAIDIVAWPYELYLDSEKFGNATG